MRKENNLEKLRTLRTDSAKECSFRESGGTNFENFPSQCQSWWRLREFHICTGLPKKTLDTSLALFIVFDSL